MELWNWNTGNKQQCYSIKKKRFVFSCTSLPSLGQSVAGVHYQGVKIKIIIIQ